MPGLKKISLTPLEDLVGEQLRVGHLLVVEGGVLDQLQPVPVLAVGGRVRQKAVLQLLVEHGVVVEVVAL